MNERRMSAYYYDFDATGSETIDKILGAVACAGKAYQDTENWEDVTSPYDDHAGETPIEWIQNAAFEAAGEIARLREALERIANTAEDAAVWWLQDLARAALAEEEKS